MLTQGGGVLTIASGQSLTHGQTDRQTERERERQIQTGRQTDRQADRQHRQTERQAGRQIDKSFPRQTGMVITLHHPDIVIGGMKRA